MTKDLSEHLKDVTDRPVFRELDEAGYQYVGVENGYWLMRHTEDKPVIYYDWATDTTVPFIISEQFETYMDN